MKGSFYGLRGKLLSLVLIALVCTTVFVLAWEKNPLLTAIRPSQSKLLPVYTEVRADVESSVAGAPDISDSQDKFAISKTIDKEKGSLNFSQNDSSKSSIEMVTVVKNTTASLSAKDEGSDAKEEETKEPINSISTNGDENLSVTKEHGNSSDIEVFSSAIELKRKHPEDSGGKKSDKEETVDSRSQSVATGFNSSKEGRDDRQQSLLERDDEQQSSSKKTEACNYAKGRWVVDDKLPLYSGFGCKQWLSAMWACRLTQRMNFDYEKLRWQPKDCQMEDFEGSKFLKRMQHKTLAFIGDSLGRQQFQSLMCMITGGLDRPDVENVGKEYGLVKPKGAIRPDGWVYRFPSTNTTILYYWSASLCDLEPLDASDPATYYAMHLDRAPSFLRWNIHKFDVLVLNTGHHWNRGKINGNRWIMHVEGKPNTNKKIADIWHAKNFTVHSIVKWVDDQLPKYPSLKAFFRTISPRHFVNGDWNTGGSCNNEVPSSIGKELLQEKSTDLDAAHAVKGTKVTLLDITALSQLRDEGHISQFSIKGTKGIQDCLHWCLPGVPDTWNEILFAQI